MGARRSELSWSDVDRMSRVLARHIADVSGIVAFDRVLGVARGGLIPAVLIAAHLEVKQVESVQVRLYDGSVRLDEPLLIGPAPAPTGPSGDPARTLVVDEIFDSGRTMAYLHGILPTASLAALVARHASGASRSGSGGLAAYCCPRGPDATAEVWAVEALQTDDWVLFPWSPSEDRAAREGRG